MTRHKLSSRTIGRHLAVLCTLTLAVTAVPVAAQDARIASRVRERMQPFVDQKVVSGCVTLVGRADGIVSVDVLGRRSIEDNLPMQADTIFRIASMTKPITAIGTMMLVDEGKVGLDDPVEQYLPEFRGQMMVASKTDDTITLKKPTRPITLRDCFTHTSGLTPALPQGLTPRFAKQTHTLAEAVMAYSQRPLDYEPGSKWTYCNTGIDTLGRVIEVVSGQPYASFLKERLFDPLGMPDTTFDPTAEQLKRVAVLYVKKDGELRPGPQSSPGVPMRAIFAWPAGGLYSTAGDLAKIYQMLLNKGTSGGRRYLTEAAITEMTRVQTSDLKAGQGEGLAFGLGWNVVRQPTGNFALLSAGAFGHGGAFGTQCWIDPKKGLFSILMIQFDGNSNDETALRRAMVQIAFEE